MKINKILVIDGAMVSRSPHVKMYLNALDNLGIEYDVIGWNRKGDDLSDVPNNYYIYDNPTDDHYPVWRKIWEIYGFYKYFQKNLGGDEYKAVIIFEIANTILFTHFLERKYKNRYIFDIRDYSPVCKFWLARVILSKLINNSYRTVISSAGFKTWLPKCYDYLISHNIDIKYFNNLKNSPFVDFHAPLRILTIGNLRDPEINCELTRSFGNDMNFDMRFVGYGYAGQIIQKFCSNNNIANVSFHGRYKKSEEISFYEDADIINCCMGNNMLSNYLMSNRIYLAALLRKPIICIKGSYQSNIVQQYNLGCIVNNINNMKNELQEYLDRFDRIKYLNGVSLFLQMVEIDQKKYLNQIEELTELE